jgi:hypothetical protein
VEKVKQVPYPFNWQRGKKAKGNVTMKTDMISEKMNSSRTYEMLEVIAREKVQE